VAEVRLFAVLRELADARSVQVEGDSVEQLVQALCDRYGERFTAIVRVSSIVVNGERASLEHRVVAGDEVAILPPVSGGAE
jgi:MoaD family protein